MILINKQLKKKKHISTTGDKINEQVEFFDSFIKQLTAASKTVNWTQLIVKRMGGKRNDNGWLI
jgi:hypothetical protein